MRTCIIFLFLLISLPQVALCQLYETKKFSRWSVEIDGGLVRPGLRYGPVEFIQCIEGCTTQRHQSVSSGTFGLLAGYRLNEKHLLQLGYNFGSYKFDNDIKDHFGAGDGIFQRRIVHQYIGFSAHHQIALVRSNQADLFLKNGLQYDLNNSDEGTLINRHGLSYLGHLGVDYHLSDRYDLILAAQFRTALLRMNEDFPFDWDKAYYPFAYGVVVGVRRLL